MFKKFVLTIASAALLAGMSLAQQAPKSGATKKAVAAQTLKPADTKAEAKTEAVPATEAKLPDEQTVLGFYNRMFGFQQNLNFKVADIRWSEVPGIAEVTAIASTPEGQQISRLFVTSDGKHAISGEMVPFGKDPYAENRDKLKQAFGPVRGSATPEVTLVEFADLECPACKAAQPTMDKLMSDVPNGRLIFQSFPLTQLHPWAMEAASYLDCIDRTDNQAALTFMEAVFSHQGEITKENATEKFKSYAAMAKVDPTKMAACAANPATQARVEKGIELGKELKITGTPTLFVNGRPINNVSGMPYDVLKSLVEFEATQK